jgi:hypothetical protein
MGKIDGKIEKYVGEKISEISDQEIRSDTIAWINKIYATLLHLEQSGESAEAVIKAVRQLTHEDLRAINHKVSAKFPSDASNVFATVMDATRGFTDSMSTIIVQIRAERASAR